MVIFKKKKKKIVLGGHLAQQLKILASYTTVSEFESCSSVDFSFLLIITLGKAGDDSSTWVHDIHVTWTVFLGPGHLGGKPPDGRSLFAYQSLSLCLSNIHVLDKTDKTNQ